jgi:hypothetical protein
VPPKATCEGKEPVELLSATPELLPSPLALAVSAPVLVPPGPVLEV